ncbi:MAG: hypothetical protein JNK55_04515 [Rubrivivax sp.]|nr:hypothetical protein [Rubrivivax sp.]
METSQPAPRPARYALCFQSLSPPRRTLRFPCDARGRVELDGLTEPALRQYLYARVVMGHELAMPRVLQDG